MLRVGILESEEVAKDIMFQLSTLLENKDCSFQYFSKISHLAKAEEEKEFHVLIFHERFENPRITQSFILRNPQRIVIYTKNKLNQREEEVLPFARIFYIHRNNISSEMKRIYSYIKLLLQNQDTYMFSYNSVKVPLKISDIYYIEKEDKYLIYHTKRGEFRERKSMKIANAYFESYHFLWVHASFLVNMQYITCMENDFVYLQKQRIPIARSRKREVIKQIHAYVKAQI